MSIIDDGLPVENKYFGVILYTDGACKGNPGPGGWCAILAAHGRERVLCGGERNTTNNRMELTAAIEGLSALTRPCDVTLCSDSQYVINGLEKGWAKSWKKNGWKKGDGEPALNPDLWERLLSLADIHTLHFDWVRGHAGHEFNERCDKIASEQADNYGQK